MCFALSLKFLGGAKMHFGVKFITKAAIIAAIYAAVTVLLQPISFGPVQFRVSEALTILPVIMPEAIPGLFVGCLIANLLGGGVLLDVIIGSLATLGAALATRCLRKYIPLAAAMPVVFNGILVGPVVYYCYVMGSSPFSLGTLLFTCLTVAIGEVLVLYTLGLLLYKALKNTPLARG